MSVSWSRSEGRRYILIPKQELNCVGMAEHFMCKYARKEHVHTVDAAAAAGRGSVKWTQEKTETSLDCNWVKLRTSLIRTVLNQMLLVTFCYSH